jgi:hypothetical protein
MGDGTNEGVLERGVEIVDDFATASPTNGPLFSEFRADHCERIGDDDMADERAPFGFDESGINRDVDVSLARYNRDAEYGVINGGRKEPSGNSRSKQPARKSNDARRCSFRNSRQERSNSRRAGASDA